MMTTTKTMTPAIAPHTANFFASSAALLRFGEASLSPQTGNLGGFHDRHDPEWKTAQHRYQDAPDEVVVRLSRGSATLGKRRRIAAARRRRWRVVPRGRWRLIGHKRLPVMS